MTLVTNREGLDMDSVKHYANLQYHRRQARLT